MNETIFSTIALIGSMIFGAIAIVVMGKIESSKYYSLAYIFMGLTMTFYILVLNQLIKINKKMENGKDKGL